MRKLNDKTLGYAIRLAAVIVWGILPLAVRYSPSAQIPDVFTQASLYFAGGLLFSIFMVIIQSIFKPALLTQLRLPWSYWLIVLLVSEISIVAFTYLSLNLTSGTHFILLNNFAPVLALLVAWLLWRQQLPYLQEIHHQWLIFSIFISGSLGSSLLFIEALHDSSAGTIEGNLWALGAVITDVSLVIAQIRYIRQVAAAQVPLVNLYIFALALPLFMLLFRISPLHILDLPPAQLGWGLLIGVLGAFGYYLNYEAFRRIDGFIAFLLFNLSIFITFCIEAFVLQAIPPSWLLLISGTLIIGAAIQAEKINSQCEQERASKTD